MRVAELYPSDRLVLTYAETASITSKRQNPASTIYEGFCRIEIATKPGWIAVMNVEFGPCLQSPAMRRHLSVNLSGTNAIKCWLISDRKMSVKEYVYLTISP